MRKYWIVIGLMLAIMVLIWAQNKTDGAAGGIGGFVATKAVQDQERKMIRMSEEDERKRNRPITKKEAKPISKVEEEKVCLHPNLGKPRIYCNIKHYNEDGKLLPPCLKCPDCNYYSGAYPGWGTPPWIYEEHEGSLELYWAAVRAKEAKKKRQAEEAAIEREALIRAKAAQKINELNKQTDPNKPSMKEMFYRPSDKWFDKYGDNMDTVLGFNLKIVLHNNVLMAEKISELEKRIINLEAKDPNE